MRAARISSADRIALKDQRVCVSVIPIVGRVFGCGASARA